MSGQSFPAAPSNNLVNALLTDLYQLTMCYAYWDSGVHNDPAVFELFFRKNPFGGEFTIFAGLEECLKYVEHFRFSESDIEYLKACPAFSHADPKFFDEYLANLSCAGSNLKIYALSEGTLSFPREPLLRVEGPLGLAQLLETTLLTLINFPSLVSTNAARMKIAAGPGKQLAEFGLRRAQGPDGGFSASKYCVIGGFDATSNVLAGKLLGIPIVGTHAHAFVQSFTSLDQVKEMRVAGSDNILYNRVLHYRENILGGPDGEYSEIVLVSFTHIINPGCYLNSKIIIVFSQKGDLVWNKTNDGELAAFISYGCSFPSSFLCLIDTYNTIESGLRNFVLVALALDDFGFIAKGIRLDSGNLSDLSKMCWSFFDDISKKMNRSFMKGLSIVASNDINEDFLLSLDEDHKITTFGIGTHLVTCQSQPALGCVYKLVQLNNIPRIKLSENIEKVLIPGTKNIYRLYGEDDSPIVDLMTRSDNGKRLNRCCLFSSVSNNLILLHFFNR